MEKFLVVKEGNAVIRVSWTAILYIVREGRKLKLVTEDGDISFYGRMKELSLEGDPRFYRLLDGLVLNLERIRMVENLTVHFDQGSLLTVSRENVGRLKQRLYSYLKSIET